MTKTKIQKELFELSDKEYAVFQRRIIPNIDPNTIIGVRTPILRKFIKDFVKKEESNSFLDVLPHKYYEENIMHGSLIASIKDYDETIKRLNAFLPYINNWAVCDTITPVSFKKNKDKLIKEIIKWSKSKETYTCRFGIEMLMAFYLDDDFNEEYLTIPAKIKSNEYYVNMMIAWFFATALAKRWDETIVYLTNYKLSPWVHNKTIQKAIDSYRISDKQKDYLRALRIKKKA